ncbi:polyprenyl synthetase family protein [Streptomyces sp. NBC_00503]|uniref:polyprenyl synthetase family protein n=1 Tax=Streptomyces sp. NBC_00503 TaxID=2903659 RepID=UPI002E808407|nr:polyprenyl synthetase family protein [Streptomyces sp. NBC_00503]WUD79534.1 polyprenyl synthetase family protein [Streptomyces sp. NBC_00503]
MNDTATTARVLERIHGHRTRFDARFERYFDTLGDRLDVPAASRFAPRCLELLRELSMRGGKRLRVVLLHEAARLVTTEEPPGLAEAGLSLELLQTHGLVHDDIIDDAPLRRGGPSTYYAYRDELPGDLPAALGLAVLAGDLAAFLSMQVLLEAEVSAELRQALLAVQIRTAAETVTGQMADLERDTLGDPDEDFLHAVTEFKSARYSILAPLTMGLLAAGEDPAPHRERLHRYARLVGISEQMHDDYLDLFGEAAQVGKSTGADLRAGRRTYAVNAVLDCASGSDAALVEAALGDPGCSEATISRIREIARHGGADRRLRAEIRRYAGAAGDEAASWAPYWRPDAVEFFRSLPLWNIDRLERVEAERETDGTAGAAGATRTAGTV